MIKEVAISALAAAAAGCAHAPVADWGAESLRRPECFSEKKASGLAGKAEEFIRKNVVALKAAVVHDAGKPPYSRSLDRCSAVRCLAVVSHPGSGDRMLKGRSFMYDNALALLWFSWTGDSEKSSGVAETMLALQNSDGSFGFSFSTGEDGFYNARYVRPGVVAWAAHALAYYSGASGYKAAGDGARAAVDWLKRGMNRSANSPAAGLIFGGTGRWTRDYKTFDPAFVPDEAVAEHQFDASMALGTAGEHQPQSELDSSIMAALWNAAEGRFAAAAGRGGRNEGRALDSAGAWGGLYLLMSGRNREAAESYRYSLREFRTKDGMIEGFRPYLDPVDGELTPEFERLVFFEGLFGMGLLAYRLGNAPEAADSLKAGYEALCLTGGGIPYSSVEARDFPATPAAAPTLWFLFLDREMGGSGRAPLFQPSSGGSTEVM